MDVQLAIDPFYEASGLTIRVETNVNHPGGSLFVGTNNEMGKTLAGKRVAWTAERDLQGLPRALSRIGGLFLWLPYDVLPLRLPGIINQEMPKVPALRGRPS
jgi:hypothetical protein